jgi:hypothetical protein
MTTDIYYVVDHGGPGVYSHEEGDKNIEGVECNYTIYEKDCSHYGNRFEPDEELGYWKIVQSWFHEAYKKYRNEKKNKDDTK